MSQTFIIGDESDFNSGAVRIFNDPCNTIISDSENADVKSVPIRVNIGYLNIAVTLQNQGNARIFRDFCRLRQGKIKRPQQVSKQKLAVTLDRIVR